MKYDVFLINQSGAGVGEVHIYIFIWTSQKIRVIFIKEIYLTKFSNND